MLVGILILFAISQTRADNQTTTAESSQVKSEIINETALILTPFIESGKIDEARSMSEVKSEIFFGVQSYSGFLTVDKTYNSNIFFWYFPIENQPVSENPCIIWLQGGPGSSSMDGLFEEIGPFAVINKDKIIRNPYTWLQNHSLVFIDSPVGSGFSFTDHNDGFTKDMATYKMHLKIAALQLLQLFPELKTVPLFVAGESYGGKYAPALAIELHKAKEDGLEVNLKGVITGNGYVDPSVFSHKANQYYHKGIVSAEDIGVLASLNNAFPELIKTNSTVAATAAYNVFTQLYNGYFIMSGLNMYNINDDAPMQYGKYDQVFDRGDVRRAIHVGNSPFTSFNSTVNQLLGADFFLSSSRPFYEELLNHYKVLAYCGLLDLVIPCNFESEEYRTWIWSNTADFISAPRYVYYFNNKKSGYYKSGGRFTEVQIRKAGHFAPMDTPELLRDLVGAWTHELEPVHLEPLKTRNESYYTDLIQSLIPLVDPMVAILV